MILSKPLIRAVLEGRKREHRQPRAGSLAPGKTVALRPPGQPGDGTRIRILDTHEQRLGDLTLEDARAEGMKTRADFARSWLARHDRAWLDRHDGETVIEYGGTQDDETLALFFRRHAHRTVTVIEFELDTAEHPRYLMSGSPLTEGGKARLLSPRKVTPRPATPREVSASEASGYTLSPARALTGEPEPLSDSDYQRHVAKRAGMTAAQYVALEKARFDREVERLSLGRRLDKAIEDARREGRQVTREVRVIEQRLRALENQRRAA